jgi:hypothetical protein
MILAEAGFESTLPFYVHSRLPIVHSSTPRICFLAFRREPALLSVFATSTSYRNDNFVL